MAEARNAIAAEHLTVRYGSVVALDDVSVALDAPAIGLLGANGAGKSTLMRALLGLVEPDAGTVQVLGFDAAHRGELRRRLGYMPEHDCLPPQMTARDLVVHLAELRGLPRRAAALRASEVLFQVGLDEERSRLIGTFSTGMKQRVKLAQALVHAPDLVVLDEPTNGLDPAGRDEMLLIVRRLWETLGVRVLLSSHVLSDVERTCEAVLLLREGHVVSAGLLSDLGGGTSGRLLVRAVGNVEGFRAALAARGIAVTDDEGALVVEGAGRRELDAVRDAGGHGGRVAARAPARRAHARGRSRLGDGMSAHIEDIGYSRYEGERRGRLAAVWSLARFGALGTLGARRSWRSKILPIALIALAFTPTLVVLGLHAIVGARFGGRFPDLVPYGSYYLEIGIVVLLFAGITTPDLLCPDRRNRVLSLYLSTAVSRTEYVVGRMLGALLPLLLTTLAPVVVLYAGNTLFADDSLTYLKDHWADLPRIFAAGILLAAYFALIALAIASLTSRRALATGAYVGVMLASQTLAGVVAFGVGAGSGWLLLSIPRIAIVSVRSIFGDDPNRPGSTPLWAWWALMLGIMAISTLVIALRYRRAET